MSNQDNQDAVRPSQLEEGGSSIYDISESDTYAFSSLVSDDKSKQTSEAKLSKLSKPSKGMNMKCPQQSLCLVEISCFQVQEIKQ